MQLMRRIAGAAAAAAVAWSPAIALAAPSPFGIATPDSGGSAGWAGPLAPMFQWIARQQSAFYRDLTAALGDLTQDGNAALILIALSFLYGVFHAAGPGHGKAVIATYLLATGEKLKRGIVISFASAFVQALTAIVVVSVGTLLLNVTAMTMTRATDALEIASYALITLCGVWLLWSRLAGRGHHHAHADHGHGHGHHGHAHGQDHAHHNHAHHDHGHAHDHGHHQDHHHHHDAACGCGHSHAPDPASLEKPLTLARAWSAILAVGIRPCSGAIIVLVFAVSQKLYWAGILSVLVMALGTGITVAALASLAVKAKDWALRFSDGESRTHLRIANGLQILAASAILLFGLLMLGGAIAAA
jgi:nickel/cobalt exporter